MYIFSQFLTNFKSFRDYNKWGLRKINLIQNCNILYRSRDMERYGEPKLKNPCADLNGVYLDSWGTHWKPEYELYSSSLTYCNDKKDLKLVRADTFHWMINMKHIVVTFSQGKVLPLLLRCLKVVFLKSVWTRFRNVTDWSIMADFQSSKHCIVA